MAEGAIDIGQSPARIELVDADVISEATNPVVSRAHELVITDQASYEAAGEFLTTGIKSLLKKVKESCDPVVKSAKAAHAAACKQRNDLEHPLIEAENVVKQKLGAWEDHVEKLAAEAQRKAEEARREAEAAERQRQQKEREAEEARRLEEAAELEAQGRKDEAEELISQPAPLTPPRPAPLPPPPPAAIARPKAKGVSSRKKFVGEVVDMSALVSAVARGEAPISILKVDQAKLNQLIAAQDGQTRLAGVRISTERIMSGRAR